MDGSDRVHKAERLVLDIDPSEYDDPRVAELRDIAIDALEDLAVQIDGVPDE